MAKRKITSPNKSYRPNNVIYLTWKRSDNPEEYVGHKKYIDDPDSLVTYSKGGKIACVTTLYKVLVNNGWLDDLRWSGPRTCHIVMEKTPDEVTMDDDQTPYATFKWERETYYYVGPTYDGETRLHIVKYKNKYRQCWNYELWDDATLQSAADLGDDNKCSNAIIDEVLEKCGENSTTGLIPYDDIVEYLHTQHHIEVKPNKLMMEDGHIFWLTIIKPEAMVKGVEVNKYTNIPRQSMGESLVDGIVMAWKMIKKQNKK